MEQYYGVSHKAMLYRLINDKHLKSEQIKDMEVGIIEAAAKLGFDIIAHLRKVKKNSFW